MPGKIVYYTVVEQCPAAMQGVKLELFIFDTFPMAQQVTLMEVARNSEFAPVKNAPGSAADSPDTARQAILSQHQRSVIACIACA